MIKLQIIIGSTRPGRAADQVVAWVKECAEAHSSFDVEVVDLRDWDLPMFTETRESIGDFANPTYSSAVVKSWNEKIKEGDAYLMITPEYNHSISGVLKNAIDNVFVSFALRNKPMGSVAYSVGVAGGARAVEHLALIGIETELVPLRNSVLLSYVSEAFEDGKPKNEASETSLKVLLDDLSWWGEVLKEARATGQLPPAAFRR
jgi:NAD(P)H-dependent FMN reductase